MAKRNGEREKERERKRKREREGERDRELRCRQPLVNSMNKEELTSKLKVMSWPTLCQFLR